MYLNIIAIQFQKYYQMKINYRYQNPMQVLFIFLVVNIIYQKFLLERKSANEYQVDLNTLFD